MPWYKCFVHGKDFPGELISQKSAAGFYTTRFAQAGSPEEAELKVLAELKRDPRLKLPEGLSAPEKSRLFFEDIVEIRADEVPLAEEPFAWYVGDETQS